MAAGFIYMCLLSCNTSLDDTWEVFAVTGLV